MNHSHTPRPIMQAAEREEDFLPLEQQPRPPLHGPQNLIITIDPITGNDIGDLQGKPSLVDGNLTMYFESEQTRQAYLDKHKHQHSN